jgi:hypothetical protein
VKGLVLATVVDEFALRLHGRESGCGDHPDVRELSRFVGVLLETPGTGRGRIRFPGGGVICR